MGKQQARQKRTRSPRVVVSVSIPADGYQQIGQAADADGVTMSAFMAEASLKAAEKVAKREAKAVAA